ncbi:DNA repair protein RadA [Patescibacteria group bacterium]|nr:DNA repair protein RadA [Patescibacteria group bacterium]
MKLKTIYLCSKCGAESPRWSGQCMQCNSWNTLVEDVINVGKKDKIIKHIAIKPNIHLSDIHFKEIRLKTGIGEIDRVLGGGFMEDSVALLVGDPGIGKSTLTIQICDQIAKAKSVLYFSGEESVQQIAGRAKRLNLKNPISIVNINSLEAILATIDAEKPGFVVVDSVQVMGSEEIASQAGSISQVRYVTEQLMQVAKSKKIPILLIGHVTKDGQLAGPQVLTHLVDTVLYLEGDNHHQFRLLRSTKNRFGAIDEVGVFNMEEKGLVEVKNPSALFLEGRAKDPIGSVIVPVLEGTRTFLVEVQALTNYTQFGYPKRTASGFDINRLNIIIAVLNRYAKIKLDSSDVFVNVVGGLKLSEPAADLAVAMAIVSSKLQKALPPDLAIMGEVGLSGEVRSVSQSKKRIKEAEKLGFEKILSFDKVKSVQNAISSFFS